MFHLSKKTEDCSQKTDCGITTSIICTKKQSSFKIEMIVTDEMAQALLHFCAIQYTSYFFSLPFSGAGGISMKSIEENGIVYPLIKALVCIFDESFILYSPAVPQLHQPIKY